MKTLKLLIPFLFFSLCALGQVIYPKGTASGTDTYTVTVTPAFSAYREDQRFLIEFTNANTGASTININSKGAKSIVKSGTTALSAGDISAGQIFLLVYDGTTMQLIGGSGGDYWKTSGTTFVTNPIISGYTKLTSDGSTAPLNISIPAGPTSIQKGDILYNDFKSEYQVFTGTGVTNLLRTNVAAAGRVPFFTSDLAYVSASDNFKFVAATNTLDITGLARINSSPILTENTGWKTTGTFNTGTVEATVSGADALIRFNHGSAGTSLFQVGNTLEEPGVIIRVNDDDRFAVVQELGSELVIGADGVFFNLTSDAIGDIYQRNASGNFSRLASVATGNVLRSGGVATVNSWGKVTSSHVDATVAKTNDLSFYIGKSGAMSLFGDLSIGNTQYSLRLGDSRINGIGQLDTLYLDANTISYPTAKINASHIQEPTASTGADVVFDVSRTYGYSADITGNITFTTTGLKEGVTQLMIHNDSVEPTFESGMVVIGGTYVTSVDNYIMFMAVKNDLILVTISQEQ